MGKRIRDAAVYCPMVQCSLYSLRHVVQDYCWAERVLSPAQGWASLGKGHWAQEDGTPKDRTQDQALSNDIVCCRQSQCRIGPRIVPTHPGSRGTSDNNFFNRRFETPRL
jgi:hypothetical protein